MIGKKLAHYEITSQIGKGGMGEVYQAKDTKLGRDVAIKVLPQEFALDPDRVARFQREAKLLASLNHPNIATIHGLEESQGSTFLVMELVEGETLADRLKRGSIPVEEALRLALQIAEALEAAYEKGVIHRDLKPANIKVTPDDKVKVLDFGLAKAFAGDQADLNIEDSPTISVAATQKGIILGTAAYMSPEQAKGKSVDKRADIWAFGVVLFEMLTGKLAFPGDEISEVLASVIKGDSSLDLIPENIHPRIRETLSRCLQKNLKKRYADIADARYEIEQVLSDPHGVLVQTATVSKPERKLRVVLPWVSVIIILSIIISTQVVRYMELKTKESRPVSRFAYVLPQGQAFAEAGRPLVIISPDGKKIVYVANGQLYLRMIDELDARPIQGVENPGSPFFSPDGQWIGYWSQPDLRLKKIRIDGGTPVTLCEAEGNPGGVDWNTDGTIVFAQLGVGIMSVSAIGGTPELLVKQDDSVLVGPQILPDGKTLLFTILSNDGYQIAVQSLETGERKILAGGDGAYYLRTGHITYMVRNSLFAVPFDLTSLKTTGNPIPLDVDIFRMSISSPAQHAFSDTGTLVYLPEVTEASESKRALVWINREGSEEALGGGPDDYGEVNISPDGTRLALTITKDGNQDIWIRDLFRGTMRRYTFDKSLESAPRWTPDGHRIIFCSDRSGFDSIYWKATDDTGKEELLFSVPNKWIWPRSLSKDGNILLYVEAGGGSGNNIGMLSLTDENPSGKLLLQENYNDDYPQISPNGHWLAYQSDVSGRNEIYVRAFPNVDGGGKWQISNSGGNLPKWSPDGRELFFFSPPDRVMVASVEMEPTFTHGVPRLLFTGHFSDGDISPDGKKFLMVKTSDATSSRVVSPRQIIVVQNWFEELKQRGTGGLNYVSQLNQKVGYHIWWLPLFIMIDFFDR